MLSISPLSSSCLHLPCPCDCCLNCLQWHFDGDLFLSNVLCVRVICLLYFDTLGQLSISLPLLLLSELLESLLCFSPSKGSCYLLA
jgi:hypothetical protein